MKRVFFFRNLLLITIFSFFTACGGDSISEDKDNNQTKNIQIEDTQIKNASQIENHETNSSLTKHITAQIIDAPLVNLGYRCGKKEDRTNKEGKFSCKESEDVTFFVGKIELGTYKNLVDNDKIFLQDLLGLKREDFSTPSLLFMAVFLQSLGSGDNSKTITISDEVHEILDTELMFSSINSIKEVEDLVSKTGKRVVLLICV